MRAVGAGFGVRDAVGKGQVRLDIQNRGAVHQIGSRDREDGAVRIGMVNGQKLDAGQSDGVRTVGRTGSEYAHAGVAAELGRSDGGRPLALAHRLKYPDQP